MPEFPLNVHHLANQQYASAQNDLDELLDSITKDLSRAYENAGSTEPAVAMDFIYTMICTKTRENPELQGMLVSLAILETICAAALTRLITQPKPVDPLEEMLHDE